MSSPAGSAAGAGAGAGAASALSPGSRAVAEAGSGGMAAVPAAAAAAAAANPSAAASSQPQSRDALYSFDEAKLESVRRNKLWSNNPKYFETVKISPSAAMKMLMHANSGVEKGIAAGGKPVEVMGMLMGRPDTENHRALIVTDVFALPVEGAETRVLADDEQVTNYMIELGEALEVNRKERFMGWYHSHPFDVEEYSHCFLSSTDVSTQLSWQRAEDPHGNPWLAIVVDPLRSLAKDRPDFGAFRVYPPEYTAPANETPDGKIVTDDLRRVERWGSCWNRYYTLEIEYFMSSLASNVMGILTENFLWMRMLGSTPTLERETRERFPERVLAVADKVGLCEGHSSRFMRSADSISSGDGGGAAESLISKGTQGSSDLAIEQCQCQITQLAKYAIFGPPGSH